LLLLSADKTSAVADGNDMNSLVAGNSDFAFDLYGKLKGDSNIPKGNIFFSPYSISTALAMTYGGACSETQDQMATTLHFTLTLFFQLEPATSAIAAPTTLLQPKGLLSANFIKMLIL